MKIRGIKKYTEALSIEWEDGYKSVFDYLWLRDNCPSSFHQATQERNFDLLSVADDIHPDVVTYDDSQLTIEWSYDKHCSNFDIKWLYANDYCRHSLLPIEEHLLKSESWNASYGEAIYRVNCADILNDDHALLNWILNLQRLGLTIVEQMPNNDDVLEQVANRISHLRETNFGVTFNVVSKPNPNNQAYTSDALPLHTDLPNQELPPGYQFLHCRSNEAIGGESTFLDGFAAAKQLKEEDADHFKLLSSYDIPFCFKDQTHHLTERKPVIVLSQDGEVNEINYNAHIAGTFMLPQDSMRAYYRAYRHFMQILRDPSLIICFKSAPGQMVVFDNRRVLHGRSAFNPQTGQRFLRGCYIDRGDLKSKIRSLQAQLSVPA